MIGLLIAIGAIYPLFRAFELAKRWKKPREKRLGEKRNPYNWRKIIF